MENYSIQKIQLKTLKSIPIILGILCFSDTMLQYLNMYNVLLSYIMFFIIYGFIYTASYMFKFCNYHRMIIHYVIGTNIISIYDSYVGIPISNLELYRVYVLYTGICIIIALTQYVKHFNNKRIGTYLR